MKDLKDLRAFLRVVAVATAIGALVLLGYWAGK